SFTGVMQTLRAFHEHGLLENSPSVETLATLLTAIATHRVGNRPNRIEPRANESASSSRALAKHSQTVSLKKPRTV
ncbi:MAG: hypothetical protein ABL962_15190, partial [Fimbriimonadaceae bacterium]